MNTKIAKKKAKKKSTEKTNSNTKIDTYSLFDLVKDEDISDEDRQAIIEKHERLNSPHPDFSDFSNNQEISKNFYSDKDKEKRQQEKDTHIKQLKKDVIKRYGKINIFKKLYNIIIANTSNIFKKKIEKEKIDVNNLEQVNIDKLILKKGQKIKIKNIPLTLESDVIVTSNRYNIKLTNIKE